MGFITVWNYRTRIEIVGIMRSTDIIIMTGLGIELVVMLWYMFIVYWKVEKAL